MALISVSSAYSTKAEQQKQLRGDRPGLAALPLRWDRPALVRCWASALRSVLAVLAAFLLSFSLRSLPFPLPPPPSLPPSSAGSASSALCSAGVSPFLRDLWRLRVRGFVCGFALPLRSAPLGLGCGAPRWGWLCPRLRCCLPWGWRSVSSRGGFGAFRPYSY